MKKSTVFARVILMACCIGLVAVGAAAADESRLPKRITETITTRDGSTLSFDMVLIPGGTFLMGSPSDEPDREEHEGPQRKVRLDPFYLCTTPATVELFLAFYQETGTAKREFMFDGQGEEQADDDVDAITGPTPIYGDITLGHSRQHPAMGMTWHNAMTFCRWLSQKTGRNYRLPTEAEWEYAARAGSTSAFGVSDSADDLDDYAWFETNSDWEPKPVGQKKPNAWGLHDMLGNVREWVQDFYSPTAYKDAQTVNPTGPKEGRVHVARGGYYDSPAEELRVAARAFEEDWWRMNDPQIPKSIWWLPQIDFIGFRVACEVPKDK